ncbi:unnamed protein product [Darwinula stevensoni]|uniref:SCP domain-containing protein n=1 Tax=Darwinula stevensoni TaxID=69355 RepID=A0A7R9A3K6_9CRUS|nr:unnamed protein product [Darwinula stevensoni]CAG0881495.1 unnamed protein product [Darwinula stevensoni]
MSSESEVTFAEEVLRYHNEYRALHGSAPLCLHEEINEYSQTWAKHLANLNQGMMHRKDVGRKDGREYGENLYSYWSTEGDPVEARDVVDAWYNEIELFDFGQSGTDETGHFTQLVWTRSRRMGVGRAQANDGQTWYVVCNYDPPGNFSGYYTYCVPRPLSQTGGKVVCREPDFESGMLEQHNIHRRNHGSPPLRLDRELSRHSQEWAEKLAEEDQGMRHRPREKLGVNLFKLKSSAPGCPIIPKDIVDFWYNRISSFNFQNPERNPLSTRSATQVIWKESELLGVGSALTKDGKSCYVVALYDPPGNITGRFSPNVLPPTNSSDSGSSSARSTSSTA